MIYKISVGVESCTERKVFKLHFALLLTTLKAASLLQASRPSEGLAALRTDQRVPRLVAGHVKGEVLLEVVRGRTVGASVPLVQLVGLLVAGQRGPLAKLLAADAAPKWTLADGLHYLSRDNLSVVRFLTDNYQKQPQRSGCQ